MGIYGAFQPQPAARLSALASPQVPFIGFWQVAEGICFTLCWSDLWDSADIQESATKTCCSYPRVCVLWQIHRAQVSWQQVLFMEKQTQAVLGRTTVLSFWEELLACVCVYKEVQVYFVLCWVFWRTTLLCMLEKVYPLAISRHLLT